MLPSEEVAFKIRHQSKSFLLRMTLNSYCLNTFNNISLYPFNMLLIKQKWILITSEDSRLEKKQTSCSRKAMMMVI